MSRIFALLFIVVVAFLVAWRVAYFAEYWSIVVVFLAFTAGRLLAVRKR